MEEGQDINLDDNDDAPMQQQSYSIATGKERVLNQPKRFRNMIDENLFRYKYFVEFALSGAETIDVLEP